MNGLSKILSVQQPAPCMHARCVGTRQGSSSHARYVVHNQLGVRRFLDGLEQLGRSVRHLAGALDVHGLGGVLGGLGLAFVGHADLRGFGELSLVGSDGLQLAHGLIQLNEIDIRATSTFQHLDARFQIAIRHAELGDLAVGAHSNEIKGLVHGLLLLCV